MPAVSYLAKRLECVRLAGAFGLPRRRALSSTTKTRISAEMRVLSRQISKPG